MFNLVFFFVLIFGALNWFCIGIFQFDIIAGIFGSQAFFLSRFVYGIIGLSGFYFLILSAVKRGNLVLKPYANCPSPNKSKSKNNKNNEPALNAAPTQASADSTPADLPEYNNPAETNSEINSEPAEIESRQTHSYQDANEEPPVGNINTPIPPDKTKKRPKKNQPDRNAE